MRIKGFRFKRPCSRCNRYFIPTGRFGRFCDICKRKKHLGSKK